MMHLDTFVVVLFHVLVLLYTGKYSPPPPILILPLLVGEFLRLGEFKYQIIFLLTHLRLGEFKKLFTSEERQK